MFTVAYTHPCGGVQTPHCLCTVLMTQLHVSYSDIKSIYTKTEEVLRQSLSECHATIVQNRNSL